MPAMARSFATLAIFGSVALASLATAALTTVAHAEDARPTAARAPVPIDGVAAIVETTTIFKSDIASRARLFEKRLSNDPIKRRAEILLLSKEILSHLIDEELIRRDAARSQIEASDAEVSDGITAVAQNNKMDKKALELEIVNLGYTMGQYRDEIRRQIIEQRWIMMRAGGKIDRKKTPDAASFQAAFDKIREGLVADLRTRAFIEIR